MNIFELAAINRYRFPHPNAGDGITTEQLFDLPLLADGPCLNSVAQSINNELKGMETESFVEVSSPDKSHLESKLDIVKHVIKLKQDAAKDAQDRVLRSEKRKKLIAALTAKEDAKMEGMSEKQLLKELDALDE